MVALVTGGASSGKSAFAERLACSLADTRTYLATMRDDCDEARLRIGRHQRLRQGLGFGTVECPYSLRAACAEGRHEGVALLEDLGNLCSNALFPPCGRASVDDVLVRLDAELSMLQTTFEHVVVVTVEAGCAGDGGHASTGDWLRVVGTLGCALAERADVVVEVACGIPRIIKGRLAWA